MAAKKRKKHGGDEAGRGLDAVTVLRAFRELGRPLSEKDLLRQIGIGRARRHELEDVLDELVEAGRIIRINKAYGLTESMNLVAGRLEIQRSGVGFVIPDDKRRKDIFINPRELGDAWHGDRVVAAVTRERKNKSHEGRVARIVERGVSELPCRVVKRMGRFLLCRPSDPRMQMSFMADYDPKALGGTPGTDEIVNVSVGDKLEYKLYSGSVRELFGAQEDALVQERLVKLNHAVPTEFPARVLAAAEELPEVPAEADFAGREDLRQLDLVTIDGAKARDFDDAVFVRKTSRGFTLFVAIADVAHYVPQASALDREALERGNSYYFPQSVEPMFPERLSNGLCSLNPRVPRLAMVAEMDFSARGVVGACRFYPAVIESKARLTYAQVNRALFENNPEERERLAAVLPMLETAEKLARLINALRTARGGLDFDLPEPEIHFNLYGETVDIRPRVRNFAHQIIEEFMIAANEAVARHLTERGAPLLYRVHPDPDPAKLESLFGVLGRTALGSSLPPRPGAGDLPAVLAAASGTDLDYLVSRLALRSMMQASYSPVHARHFGLASECYCHFTSPIRRYADLVVHRALKLVLAGQGDKAVNAGKLQRVADHLSKRERVAMDAEREILKRLTVLLLADQVGRRFTGVVNSLADFGFWVEFKEVMAEGMVRLSSLSDDYYAFFPERQELVGERTGRVLRLGDPVTVELVGVDLGRLEVNLELVSGGQSRAGKGKKAARAEARRAERKAGALPEAAPLPKAGARSPGKASGQAGRKSGGAGAAKSAPKAKSSKTAASAGRKSGKSGARKSSKSGPGSSGKGGTGPRRGE